MGGMTRSRLLFGVLMALLAAWIAAIIHWGGDTPPGPSPAVKASIEAAQYTSQMGDR